MTKVDDLRKRFAAPKVAIERHEGVPITEAGGTDLAVARLNASACPACGKKDKLQPLGFRHGGVHTRCEHCGFEYTVRDDADERRKKLIGEAAIRYQKVEDHKRETKELYERARRERKGNWWRIDLPNGDRDAMLNFGKHRNKLISELAAEADTRSYLRWMMLPEQAFDPDLLEIVQMHIDGTDGR